ncbi:DUF4345 domain-containing protein [Sphingomonas sp. Leaf25]|uniref:DUF4345 domain-containing protein n=1 Tax=Sphingomonas sp. Leaf25 TaxID=1735692 RepID=UPI0006F36CD4|nr:DUF4345 domain-containing protein [Sphingomonas sp. Leaf25]KQM98785.1 hypothetical protein ASE78_06040 [Sphingomonas sp. Leaf25]
MSPRRERTLLQAVVALACIVPLTTGTIGIVRGAGWLQSGPAVDLDSHFRYLSGIFVVMGLGFVGCIPGIERKGTRLRLLGAMVVAGGMARLLSLAELGMPSTGHVAGLCIELIGVPLILGWQTRVAHRCRMQDAAPAHR